MKELNPIEAHVMNLFHQLNTGGTCVAIAKKSTDCNCSFKDIDGKCMLSKIANNLKRDGYMEVEWNDSLRYNLLWAGINTRI